MVAKISKNLEDSICFCLFSSIVKITCFPFVSLFLLEKNIPSSPPSNYKACKAIIWLEYIMLSLSHPEKVLQ